MDSSSPSSQKNPFSFAATIGRWSGFKNHSSATVTSRALLLPIYPIRGRVIPIDGAARLDGAAAAVRPAAVVVGGAGRGAPGSQSAYRRVCVAATPKGAAQRGCSATGPTPDGRRRGTGTIQKWSQSPCATGPPP